jgi:hypothetical protein
MHLSLKNVTVLGYPLTSDHAPSFHCFVVFVEASLEITLIPTELELV